MECLSYCVANQIDLVKLERQLRPLQSLSIERHWKVIVLHHKVLNTYCYVFANGTLVGWNIKRYQMLPYLKLVEPACIGKFPKPLFDGFSYKFGEKTTIRPHGYFNVECLVLESDDPEIKLSLSYGFSQSIKLKYFEDQIDTLIERNTPFFNQLSNQGRLKISRSAIRRIIGDILAVKGEINITGNFYYHPKFFWKHPHLETYFIALVRYLDVAERTDALNKQLNTLNEIFFMFNSYLENKHAHNLEIIIIVLIMIEIVFSVLNLHL